MKNLTWQNPEQLFVAQELINKVKSKCCGIKVDKLFSINFENKETGKQDFDISTHVNTNQENKIYINSSFSPTNNQTSFLSNSLRKGSSLNSEEPRLIPKKRKTKKRKL